MSYRVMARKAFEFVTEDGTERVRVEPLVVSTVPDWVIKDDLFRLAKQCENIEIMGSTTADMSIGEIEELQERAKELGIRNFKSMKASTLKEKIAEFEITPSSGVIAMDSSQNEGQENQEDKTKE